MSITKSSFYTAFLFFLLTLIYLLSLQHVFSYQLEGWAIWMLPIFIFLLVFIIFQLILEKYIYSKIRVIYKIINDIEVDNPDGVENNGARNNILVDLESEVKDWAKLSRKVKKKVKRKENYRKEFLGDVSHELKTPIFNIQGYLESLLDGGIHDEKINIKFLKKAVQNVERLDAIVQDLEVISQSDNNDLTLNMTEFSIVELIDEILDNMEDHALKNSINLFFNKDFKMDNVVLADKVRISQVLMNLVSNSIKYGKSGGQTKVSIFDLDQQILIEVADDGIGIEKKHLPRLFDRFYRVDDNRSREHGGTGLGLSIVKHILETHNQSLNVRSSFGIGTSFTFTLKKARANR